MSWAAVVVTSTIVSTGYQVERGLAASREQKRARRAQSEARAVSGAQKENERQVAIREQVREERIRRAQVMSAAEAAGVSGSSVEASTIGSGQTIAAAGQAFASGATLSANLQSDFLQQAADAQSRAAFDQAQGQMGGALAQLGMSAFSSGLVGGKGAAPTTTSTTTAPANTGVNLDYGRFSNYS